jgi:hypothetical protein
MFKMVTANLQTDLQRIDLLTARLLQSKMLETDHLLFVYCDSLFAF